MVAIAEIDKYAIGSYEALHGETLNLGDISQINTEEIPDHDLFTYSFPCQDISIAGGQEGLDMGSGTRSGLLWECQKVISVKNPKYLLLENVKNLVGKRHKANFDKWLEWLESQGYTNYWQVLNAKDYGIPQNRERVFVVSILGEHESFEFPEKQELSKCLGDLLETEVEEKFFLKPELQQRFKYTEPSETSQIQVIGNTNSDATSIGQRNRCYSPSGIMATLSSTVYKQAKQIIVAGNVEQHGWYRMMKCVADGRGITPTLTTCQGGYHEQKVLIRNATKLGYLEATEGDGIDLAYPNSNTRRGRVQKKSSPTLQTADSVGTLNGDRIRKLTPLEYWRLMGFSDEQFYRAQAINSNSQLYKQAGNGIVVPVLEAIFEQLFIKEEKL